MSRPVQTPASIALAATAAVAAFAVGGTALIASTARQHSGEVIAAGLGDVTPLPDRPASVDGLNASLNEALALSLAESPAFYVGDDGEIISVERVRAYLERKGSPLVPYAEDFVVAGIDNDVDPRVVIAIAGAESTFGKRQLGHNAWGWGASTTAAMKRWPDWSTSIHEYTAALGERYDTDNVDEAFARRYVPPNWRWWLRTVRAVMAEV